ncbi:hypothetical protein EB72_24810 [Mycobacterium sp. SWH-M1]|nr:hypothetical protein EB72_24810 [Mycobacterium sp. SWH-M1]
MTRPPDPVEAEATGQQYISALYGGQEYKLALDADDWPLELIRVSVGVDTNEEERRLVPHYGVLVASLQQILGDQWDDFLQAFPKRKDLVPASQAFATAIGFPPGPNDPVFGALPRLLANLYHWRDAVEATLGEMGLDYTDRWRFDADGRRLLTLRKIHVRLSHARYDSPLAIAHNGGRIPKSGQELLLMDVFEAITRQAHPSRPLTPEQRAEREKAKSAQSKHSAAIAEYRKNGPKSRFQHARETAQANALEARKVIAHAQEREAAQG